VAGQKYGHNDLTSVCGKVEIWAQGNSSGHMGLPVCVARWKYRHRDLSNVCGKVQIWSQASASVCGEAEIWIRNLPMHVVR